MAIKEIRTDDIDGSENASSVSFSLDGVSYKIDLAERNKDKLDKALAPFIEKAERVGRSSSPAKRSGGIDNTAVREWAQAEGIEVSPRGRIAQSVIEAYLKR
jgi:hypothetical protein